MSGEESGPGNVEGQQPALDLITNNEMLRGPMKAYRHIKSGGLILARESLMVGATEFVEVDKEQDNG